MADGGEINCTYCASTLAAGARFCPNCKKFQGWWDRFAGAFSLSTLATLIPTSTLAIAFLNQTVIIPYSRVAAAVSSCSRDGVVLALSNTGTRKAIVNGGTAGITAFPAVHLSLRPGEDRMSPIVIAPGDNLIARIAFADPENVDQPQPMPIAPQGVACSYRLRLTALEFGGGRREVDAGSCTCSV